MSYRQITRSNPRGLTAWALSCLFIGISCMLMNILSRRNAGIRVLSRKKSLRRFIASHTRFHETNQCHSYWEETLDAGNFSSSIIFDSVLGFGGNGRAGDGCITDGPFSNYTNSVGPGYELTNHCINRNVSDADSLSCSQKSVDYCNSLETYDKAWPCIEAEPHKGGHAGVGGEVSVLSLPLSSSA